MSDPHDYYPEVAGLRVTLTGSILEIALDRPEKRNAMNDGMIRGLADVVEAAGRDDRVRVIELRGAGDHFCTGADILARNPAGEQARPKVGGMQRRLPTGAHRLIPTLLSVQVPVVCVVRGWAAGLGLHLAAAADFTLASTDARFWEPFSERGFTPDSAGTWLLPRLVGVVRARELLLLGRAIDGVEAVAWGLIHAAHPTEDLDREAAALVARLAGGATVTLGLTKWLLLAGHDSTLEDQLRHEAFALELSSRSDDFREGIAAFRDKRPPEFTGR